MTYEEIGAILRQEREKQEITIDAVANQLKISPRLIGALESGDIASLPHPAYARGFIRSYAGFLGISPDEVQNWFTDLPTQQQFQDPPPAVEQSVPAPAATTGKSGCVAKAIAIILVLAAIAGIWLWQSGRLASFFSGEGQPTADFESRVPSAADYLAAKEQEAEEKAPPAPPAETVTAPIEVPTPETPPVAQPVTEARAPVAEEPAAQMPTQHKLVITATEECWIHSNADKSDTRQFSLRKGDTFALTFSKSLELKLGNAGGVRIRYDGKDLGPAGTSGQVRTLVYPQAAE